jgi:hypothetical protein
MRPAVFLVATAVKRGFINLPVILNKKENKDEVWVNPSFAKARNAHALVMQLRVSGIIGYDMVKNEYNKRVTWVVLWKLGVANDNESAVTKSFVMDDVSSWKGVDHVDL